jgi:hypothetical protein
MGNRRHRMQTTVMASAPASPPVTLLNLLDIEHGASLRAPRAYVRTRAPIGHGGSSGSAVTGIRHNTHVSVTLLRSISWLCTVAYASIRCFASYHRVGGRCG